MSDDPGERQATMPPAEREPRASSPRQPLWRAFLTPAAVLVGAVIIGGAILISNGDDAPPAQVTGEGTPTAQASPPTENNSQGQLTARATFASYADELGMDLDAFDQCLSNPDTATRVNAHLDAGSANGVSGTPTFFINNKRLVGAQPAPLINEIIQLELNGSPDSLDAYSAPLQELAASSPSRFTILDETPQFDNVVLDGSADAEVIIVEFSDFQCPFCQRFVLETLPELRSQLGDEVAFGFAHFPIVQIHPNAGRAALVAECADEQGAFWEMHDLLFERQALWQNLP